MDVTKKADRTALKSYFVKNAVPTAGNFADLVEGTLNQKDDGIAKLAGEPLSVQADGDATSQKKALNFYKSFADPKPAWTMSLNPRTDPNNPATAKAGWSIGDADGNSKFFIDQATGNVGVGTVAPGAKLDVNGALKVGFTFNTAKDPDSKMTYGGSLVLKGTAPQIDFLDTDNNEWAIHVNANKMYFIREPWNYQDLVLDGAGNVGIGTDAPRAKLEVRGGAIMPAAGNAATAGINFPPDPGGGGGDSAWLRWYARQGEACTLELGVSNDGDDHIALMASGNVGIGTITPRAKLEVAGGIYAGNSDLYFTNTEHSHTGTGNTAGWAALENSKNYDCLMILGRAGTSVGRRVEVWDYMRVNGTFVNNSDARMKDDVAGLEYGLKEILQLNPVSFNWKEIPNPHKSIGLIAQEVRPVIAEAVYEDAGEREANLAIAYTSLIPVLINAVKELSAKVDELSAAAKAG